LFAFRNVSVVLTGKRVRRYGCSGTARYESGLLVDTRNELRAVTGVDITGVWFEFGAQTLRLIRTTESDNSFRIASIDKVGPIARLGVIVVGETGLTILDVWFTLLTSDILNTIICGIETPLEVTSRGREWSRSLLLSAVNLEIPITEVIHSSMGVEYEPIWAHSLSYGSILASDVFVAVFWVFPSVISHMGAIIRCLHQRGHEREKGKEDELHAGCCSWACCSLFLIWLELV